MEGVVDPLEESNLIGFVILGGWVARERGGGDFAFDGEGVDGGGADSDFFGVEVEGDVGGGGRLAH